MNLTVTTILAAIALTAWATHWLHAKAASLSEEERECLLHKQGIFPVVGTAFFAIALYIDVGRSIPRAEFLTWCACAGLGLTLIMHLAAERYSKRYGIADPAHPGPVQTKDPTKT